MASAPSVFKLEILSVDFDRGWTWYLQIGERCLTGWYPSPEGKPQPTPESAYEDFMEWANRIGTEEFKKAIASAMNNHAQ